MKDYPKYGNKKSESLIRKKSVDAKRSSLKLALTWIVMILVALFFVQQRISYIRVEKRVHLLMKEKDKIQLSILPLQLEERFLTRLDKVENTAKNELNLQHARPSQTIKLRVVSDKERTTENN
jgi:cell division protein FtsL